MKNLLKAFTLVAVLGSIVSCDYESFEEETALLNLETAAPFVRLDNTDANGMRTITVSDSGQVFTVEIENPSNVMADLMIDYSLGGSADYGDVYTTDVGDASGGTISLPFDDGSNTDASVTEEITFTTQVDTLIDGQQTIEIALTGVSTDNDVVYQAGQGPLYRTLTITLVND